MKKYLLVIVADTNDADYIRSIRELSEEEWLEIEPDFVEALNTISQCDEYYNWPTSHYRTKTVEEVYESKLTQDQINLINWHIPCGEHGIHTIVSVELYTIADKEDLMKLS